MSTSYKHSIEQIKKIFDDENYKLLSTEYVYNVKLKFQCDNGHIGEILLKNFKYGQRCRICSIKKNSNNNKFSFEDIIEQLIKYDMTLLTNEYKNVNSIISFKCKNNHLNECSYSCFKLRKNKCLECNKDNKISSNKKYYDLEIVKDIFNKHNYKLLSHEYLNCKKKLDFECDKGHKSSISLLDLNYGKKCDLCIKKK